MKKALAVFAICLLAAGLFGCTNAPARDRGKDFPLTMLDSMFVPGILQSTTVDMAPSGKSFLAIKVRMENRGPGTATVSASGFRVVIDADGYACDFLRNTDDDPRFLGQDFGYTSISAKSYSEGWTVFEVPSSVRSINSGELRFSDKALLGDGAYAKLDFAPSATKRYDNASERLTVDVKSMTVTYKFVAKDGTVWTPSPENLFAVAELAVANNARTAVRLDVKSDNIAFVSSQKAEYFRGGVDTAPDTDTPFRSQTIPPSASAKGTLIYEVPADDSYINKVVIRYSAQESYSFAIPKARIDIEANNAPAARITANETGFIDTDIQFDSNASTDPDNDALAFFWDFGEKGTSSGTSTEGRPTHRYEKPDTYTVTLRVTDIGGLENTVRKGVKITHYFSLGETGHGTENNTGSLYNGEFFVDVNLTNHADRTRSVPYSLFKLKTSDGAYVEWDGDDGKRPASIAAGASSAWRVYFKVPQGKIPVSIIFDDSLTVVF